MPVSVERCQLELQSCYYFLPVQPELQRTTEISLSPELETVASGFLSLTLSLSPVSSHIIYLFIQN